jgi:hypothetical protein
LGMAGATEGPTSAEAAAGDRAVTGAPAYASDIAGTRTGVRAPVSAAR